MRTGGQLTAMIYVLGWPGVTSEDGNPTTVFITFPRGVALSSVLLAPVFPLVVQVDKNLGLFTVNY